MKIFLNTFFSIIIIIWYSFEIIERPEELNIQLLNLFWMLLLINYLTEKIK